jgi:drug/metabolite transporter (DMT)-like permease
VTEGEGRAPGEGRTAAGDRRGASEGDASPAARPSSASPRESPERVSGYWIALLAALAWAMPPILSRPAIRDGLPPLAVVVLNVVVAVPLGYGIIHAVGQRASLRRLDRRALVYLGLTGLCSTGAFLCVFTALRTESIALTMALVSTYPLWNLVAVILVERDERITWRVVVGTLAIVVGIVVVIT